jgi:CheY-like chemotaxis protein
MSQYNNSTMPRILEKTKHQQLSTQFIHEHAPFLRKKYSSSYFAQEPVLSCSFGHDEDDVIEFLAEEDRANDLMAAAPPWKILIADDDSNVHDTTLLALGGVQIHGRPLEFMHAYSAAEARKVIVDNPDTALVLLDVVMETVDAGLKLVNVIRNELHRKDLRIVLRTGQPGYAPEKQVNSELAIDGYTTKSKLTRSILISVLTDTLSMSNLDEGLPN